MTDVAVKTPWKAWGSAIGFLTVLYTAHATVILPGVIASTSKEIMKEVEKKFNSHTMHPHPGAVSDRELELLLAQFKDVAKRSDIMELRGDIRVLEERLKSVEARITK